MEALDRKQQQQPTEEEIWALTDKNPRGGEGEWPERQITWNPHEYYLHTIHQAYFAKSGFEWLFHFLKDKTFSNHKKERVLRILFRDKGRQVRLISSQPLTFMVVSQPESRSRKKPFEFKAAHVYSLTLSKHDALMCQCEWEETTAHSETCTHCISVRTYFHFLEIGRIEQASTLQGESEICTH